MIPHKNEPREVGYAKEHEEYFRDINPDLSLTHKDANSLFAGLNQKDLFIFAMAIGKHHNKTKTPKDIKRNVMVSAMSEQQKWALLAIDLSENKDALSLSDVKPFYLTAEKYAGAGMDILLKEMNINGFVEYCENLEKELVEILEE
jgi:hypothetical protein